MKTIPLEQVTEHMILYCPTCKKETLHEIAKHINGDRRTAPKPNNLTAYCYDCPCGDSREIHASHDLTSPPNYEGSIPENMKQGREAIWFQGGTGMGK